jgi:hypothetical protein
MQLLLGYLVWTPKNLLYKLEHIKTSISIDIPELTLYSERKISKIKKILPNFGKEAINHNISIIYVPKSTP